MRLLPALALLILLAPSQHAQNSADAGVSGLKGARRIYVDAGPNAKNRESITRELVRSKLGFEFLPSREGADVILFFASEKLRTATGVETRPPITGVMPDKPEVLYEDIEFGTGMAYTPLPSGGGHVLFRWEGRRRFIERAATKFAAAFLKEYKKANGLR